MYPYFEELNNLKNFKVRKIYTFIQINEFLKLICYLFSVRGKIVRTIVIRLAHLQKKPCSWESNYYSKAVLIKRLKKIDVYHCTQHATGKYKITFSKKTENLHAHEHTDT